MTPDPHPSYALLPAFLRTRDADAGYPLRALMTLIGEQVDAVEDDIAQLYANSFIETCADWAVPYIGDLVGYRPVDATGANTALTPRAEVANTIAFRRRKGTLALLEQLGGDVGGWPSRAVEPYALLARTQHVNHLRAHRGRTVDLRDGDALARIGGPFETLAHGIDVRRIDSRRTRARFGIAQVALFAWRLKTYGIAHAPACCIEDEGSQCYTMSILGNDTPLFARATPETDPTTIAQEANLPAPIRRRALATSTNLYGDGRSLAIHAPGWPDRQSPQPVPASLIVTADLTDWQHRAKRGQILLDPVTGRMVFPVRQLPKAGVWVDYRYAFSADIGGGDYPRTLAQPAGATLYPVARDRADAAPSINAALLHWRADQAKAGGAPRAAVIEIRDSAAYSEPLAIVLEAGEYLQIRAADRVRPTIRLLDYMVDGSDAFSVSGKAGSRLVLDGLLIAGRGLRVIGPDRNDDEAFAAGDLCDVTIRHATLVPGWGLTCDCEPRRPGEPSIELVDCAASIVVRHSIIGAIHVVADEVRSDPCVITVSDSIVDATGDDRIAIGAPTLPLAFATLAIARCTIFGALAVHAIRLAENMIVTGPVRVARRQVGCMRFCYVPPGSRTPRRSHCQPDAAIAQGADPAIEAQRVRPRFTSVRYGNPAYAQLADTCAIEIRRGGDDASEMGAFHDLFQPHREANLAARLREYSPAAIDAGIIFAT